MLGSGLIEIVSVGKAVRWAPRVATEGERVSERRRIAEEKYWIALDAGHHARPIDGPRFHVELQHYWASVDARVCGRRIIRLRNVIQMRDEGVRRRQAVRVPLDRTLIDHQHEAESWMRFRLRLQFLRGHI